jgi:hypothetical protein
MYAAQERSVTETDPWTSNEREHVSSLNRKQHANEHVVKTNKVHSTKMCYDTSSVSHEWQQSTMVVYESRVVDKDRTGGKYKPSVAECCESGGGPFT